jgi:hypothetical protein
MLVFAVGRNQINADQVLACPPIALLVLLMCMQWILRFANPQLTRQLNPIPPWRRYPPSPTSPQWPNGIKRPWATSSSFSWALVVLGEALTMVVVVSYSKCLKSTKSMRIQSAHNVQPARLWPPDRTRICLSRSMASCTACWICSTFFGLTIAWGNSGGIRLLKALLRANSYPGLSRHRVARSAGRVCLIFIVEVSCYAKWKGIQTFALLRRMASLLVKNHGILRIHLPSKIRITPLNPTGTRRSNGDRYHRQHARLRIIATQRLHAV